LCEYETAFFDSLKAVFEPFLIAEDSRNAIWGI
jgi:hypothetical protein